MKSLLVIMPVYNNVNFVGRAVESVLNQDYENLHLVIVDDCSTDGSFDVVNEYSDRDNVTVIKNDINRGCYYSRNRGLDIFSKGDWDIFTIHDSDDISTLNRCSKIISYFDSDDVLAVYPAYISVDTNLNPIINEFKEFEIFLNSEGIAFYTREIFDNLGYYYNTRYAGDTEYMMRALSYNLVNGRESQIKYSDEVLYYRIIHGNNLTQSKKRDTTFIDECQKEIINNMIPTKNFYREKFG